MRFILALLMFTVVAIGADGLPNQPYLHVRGDAVIEKAADMVTLSFVVSFVEPSQAAANAKAQAQANEVFALLKAAKIKDEDIGASDLSSQAEYEDSNTFPAQQRKVLGYRVSRPFEVKVRDLKIFPNLVNDLLDLKIHSFDSINESLSTHQQLRAEAWEKAIQDARERAEKLTKATGMKVDSVFAISPSGFVSLSNELLDDSKTGSATFYAQIPQTRSDPARYVLKPVTVTQSVHIIYLISPAK